MEGFQPLGFEMLHFELIDIVGRQWVQVDEVDRTVAGVDSFWVPQMLVDRGIDPPRPDFVVSPGSVEEVSRVVRLANVYNVPVIPYGGGTGSQGGIIPLHGGITLNLKRLNRIVAIDERSLTVTAQAGINGQELEWALNDRGLTLPHYPASQYGATLGGYLAPRGSGTLSTKYGKAEDMVLNVEVVLPQGEIVRTLPVPNHAAGPGILQLFLGAEGTLGVITEATMRVEVLPECRLFRALLFPSLSAGLEAGRRIMTARLQPTVIRLYDEGSTEVVVRRVLGREVKGTYMVVGFDGFRDIAERQESRALHICMEEGAEDLGREPGEEWWAHRYDFYFPPHVWALPKLFGTTDTVTTYDKIEALYHAKKNAIEGNYRAWHCSYVGHFSHWFPWGVMVYDRFQIDEPPADPREALLLHNEIWNLSVRVSLKYGGVLNEHHGVGLKLARLVREQYGGAFQVIEGLKRALDPKCVLNPGKMGFGRGV